MSALNNLLKDTSGSASTHFHNFIEENFKDEIERELSPDEVKEIEEQARENINKRNDSPLEQKEEEYEKEKAKLLGDKESEKSEVIEQLLKERIVDHPEDAGSVLGKEGAAALQEQLDNIKDKRDRAVVEEIIKQRQKFQLMNLSMLTGMGMNFYCRIFLEQMKILYIKIWKMRLREKFLVKR